MKAFTFTAHVDPEGEIIVSLSKPNSINKHGEEEKLLISETLNFIGNYITRKPIRRFEEIPALGDGDFRADCKCAMRGHHLQIEPCKPILLREIK